jgi:chitinase
VAATPAGREKFAASCADFMTKYGFDGIDIDWEYPVSGGLPQNKYRPEDKGNYTLLLQALRNKIGSGKLLTIAAPAGPSIIANMDIAPIGRVLDWINVMTYDFHGGWEAQANFNAPLYPMKGDTTKFSVSEAMDAYIAGGVAANKLVMGVPFYGRGWAGVGAANNGLLQPSTGLPTGTWEPGVFDYKDLANNYVGKGYTRYWNDEAKVPFLYNPGTQIWISYDDAESMGIKAEYIKNKGFGGAMFWELSGDNGTLLDSLNAKMR